MESLEAIPGYVLAGAVVRRPYSARGERVASGTVLSREAFLAIGHAVRRLFVREGQILPFFIPLQAAPPPAGTAHVIHRGSGRYDVVFGVQLNVDPLSREQAEARAADADRAS